MVEHGLGTDSTATTTYTVGAGNAGPHQVTSLSTTVGTSTTTSSFTYDAAGNRASQTTGADTVSYDWNAEGKLSGVHGAESNESTNTYDASGNRLARTDASGTTVYLPGGQEILINGSEVSATRYYSFAGKTVAVRSGTGMAGVSSLVCDSHGSVVASVPNTVWTPTSVKRVFSDPFGAIRGGSDAGVPGDRRFLGAVRDTGSGLTLLGARYYDESVGQFISVDPKLDAVIPAQFNAYVYSGNNPATFSDPSGMSWISDAPKTVSSSAKKNPVSSPPKDDFAKGVEAAVDFIMTITNLIPKTQNADDPLWEGVLALGFDRDEDGKLHTKSDAAQLLLGYGDSVDVAFATGSDIVPEKLEFDCGQTTSCVLWGWKGDYKNMGAGAEIGFYKQEGIFRGGEHWFADAGGYNPKTTVTLRGADGHTIVSDNVENPKAKVWCGGWDPHVQNVRTADITATMTIDFSDNKAMFDAAIKGRYDPDLWKFNERTQTITLQFRRRRKKWVR
jgi:RHS repeat-associated protein